MPARRSASPANSEGSTGSTYAVTGLEDGFFKTLYGRKVNAMNPIYRLPADEEELKRLETEHRLIRFILDGKNYVGPVTDVLAQRPGVQRRVLDCGTGGGMWAVEMADEFSHATVTGVDLAPIQPREVPPNCSFELFDLDGQRLPYPNCFFDVVHARSVYTGIRNYPQFLREVARVLRPGGLLILVEPDCTAITEHRRPIAPGPRGGAPGWFALWDAYQRALYSLGIDWSTPMKIRTMLPDAFDQITTQEAVVPVGFWPRHPDLLTIGQLAWMDHDNLLPALRPLFLSTGMAEPTVKTLIEEAQRDLYFPVTKPYTCWHFIHARKRPRPH